MMEERARSIMQMIERAFFDGIKQQGSQEKRNFLRLYIYTHHICAVNLKKIPKTSAVSFDFMGFVLLLYVVQPRVF